MGKARKVSKGHFTGFVPNYRHAVETVAESEGFGSSGHVDEGSTTSQGSCGHNRKSVGSDIGGFDIFNLPYKLLPLSKMSHLERRELEVKLKYELEQVMNLQRKVASLGSDAMMNPPAFDVSSYQHGPKRQVMIESLPTSTSDVPALTGKKKRPPGKNGPRTKSGAASVRKSEPIKQQSLPLNTGSFALIKQCETLLARLMVHQHAWVFNEPVDIVKHNIPDYFNIIKHPMDLGTVKRKLLSNQYSNPMEFASDVRLTFKNAMTYNPPGHDVHYMAEVMSKYFEVRWKPIEKKFPSPADESTPSKSSVIIEPESAYVPPAKKQKTKAVENKVKNEMDKPVMSDVEKQKLGTELEESLAELPDNVINFLKECTLNGAAAADEEIEIDIDSLSDDTLFTLRKLLDDFLLEKQKKQAMIQPCETEMQKESGFSNLSVPPCKDNELADEDVDIGGNDPPPLSSSPVKIDKDADQRKDCQSSSTSDSGSSSSDTNSEDSSANETDQVKNSVPPCSLIATGDTKADQTEHVLNIGEQNPELNSSNEGESAQPERQASPDKLYRAALLRSRYADIIIKAQENSIDKGEKLDTEKLKLEKGELERRRREEKARLQAEAKVAEEARKRAEAEAAAEAKRKRELEREAARQALLQMEKTVDINENSQFIEDLEMFKGAPDDHLRHLIEETSPEISQNGLGSFKLRGSTNPLEQLGLFMKNDEEEEDEVNLSSINQSSDDPKVGVDPFQGG
ncbi:transcription factor GTE10-like [Andrographis paniculata]|uniref:transcription factor GTE10-like n=1 Tax=Andrographis paniculata TaxID=175694 RepID=UPI0021E70664|nr:transcription factor GTE10-like [Andrographis paniculata]